MKHGHVLALLLMGASACSRTETPESEAPAEATAAENSAGTPQKPLAIKASDPALQWGACPPIFSAPGCEIAVLHGDPAKPNADILLRVPAGYVLPVHRHTSAERIILVEGELRVRYAGFPAATLTAGDYAYGPAGLAHEANCAGAAQCTLFIAFEGPVDAEAVSGPLP